VIEFLGFLFITLLLWKFFERVPKEQVEPQAEVLPNWVYIEKNQGIYYAYDWHTNEFRSQNMQLELLVLDQLKKDPTFKIEIERSDAEAVEDFNQLFAHSSSDTAHVPTQERQ
jgi:hypothetical protein